MSFSDVIIHAVNFLAPALFLAVLVPAMARLLWWRTARSAGKSGKSGGLAHQMAWVAGVNLLVWVAGLLVMGRDGAMITYAALVLASGLTVWWTGWR